MKIIKKGQYGYISFQRKIEILKTLVLLLLCVGIYYLGVYSTGSNKNLLTFVAILGVLPMARCAVSAVLFIKAKGCPENVYESIEKDGIKITFYELFMTQYKNYFRFDACLYNKDCLIFYSSDEKLDEKLAKEHVEQVMRTASVENVTVKVYKDLDKFKERALQLSEGEMDDNTVLFDNLLSVSI